MGCGEQRHIRRKNPNPYVNHYSFHILDRDWGHVTIRMSGHPPFPVQIILNGHEYVDRQARKAGIMFTRRATVSLGFQMSRLHAHRRDLDRRVGHRAINRGL